MTTANETTVCGCGAEAIATWRDGTPVCRLCGLADVAFHLSRRSESALLAGASDATIARLSAFSEEWGDEPTVQAPPVSNAEAVADLDSRACR